MTDDTPATADTPDPPALHPADDGNPDDLAGDLTDPDVDVDSLLDTEWDEDGD